MSTDAKRELSNAEFVWEMRAALRNIKMSDGTAYSAHIKFGEALDRLEAANRDKLRLRRSGSEGAKRSAERNQALECDLEAAEARIAELEAELKIVTAQRDDREEHLVDAMVGAEWVKVTPETLFPSENEWHNSFLIWVPDIKHMFHAIVDLLDGHGLVWRLANSETYYLPSEVSHFRELPQPPKGDA